jgi:hypothetical protein
MRDDQSLLLDDAVPIQNQIEIEGAGGAWMRPRAAEAPLDREQRLEQRTRRQRRVPDGGGIEKPRLVADADRIGVVEGGNAEIGDDGLQRLDGAEQVALAVAEVAAERNRDRYAPALVQRLFHPARR